MKKTITIALLLASCLAVTTLATAQDSTSQQYMAENERILAQRAAGKLTPLETTIEIEAAGKAYFPNDLLLRAYNASVRGYAEQQQQGVITRERFLELHQQRTERFEQAVAERAASVEKGQVTADTQARKSQGIGVFLNSMAQAMNRNYPKPITCSSTSMPGVVTTNCQ